jgi:3-phenylpropionate/trans-cinnamate dioxygenase ferredoxin reductase subunit
MACVLILGAGHAGGSAAAFLRQYGFEGPITLIGEEPLLPYQRPPLSKGLLKGDVDAQGLLLRPPGWYETNRCDVRSGVRAQSIDRQERLVSLSTGELVPYDHLIIATGARARKLTTPGSELGRVLELRTLADAEGLRNELGPGKRLAIIGGGYVGLEAAASARALGADVVVIEREARCLSRVACEPLSSFFQAYHSQRGVEFELGAMVEAFGGVSGQVSGIHLADGRRIECDVALVGVGAIPNDELAHRAMLDCRDGIVVDEDARTLDEHIFAIGDVTMRPVPMYNRQVRLESVPNAIEQARRAACAIVGCTQSDHEVPWFWSDQYDLKLQIAGLTLDADQILVRGDPAAASFAVFHLKGDRVRAVEAVNSPAEFMMGKRLIAAGTVVAAHKLADPEQSMREVAA